MYKAEYGFDVNEVKEQIQLVLNFLSENKEVLIESGETTGSIDNLNHYFTSLFKFHHPGRAYSICSSADYEFLFDFKIGALQVLYDNLDAPFLSVSDFVSSTLIVQKFKEESDHNELTSFVEALNRCIDDEKRMYFEYELFDPNTQDYSGIRKLGGVLDTLYACFELQYVMLNQTEAVSYDELNASAGEFCREINQTLMLSNKFEMPYAVIERYKRELFAHSSNFRWVKVEGVEYIITKTPAECVQILYEGYKSGAPWISTRDMAERFGQAYSEDFKVADKFQKRMKPYYPKLVLSKKASKDSKERFYALNIRPNRLNSE